MWQQPSKLGEGIGEAYREVADSGEGSTCVVHSWSQVSGDMNSCGQCIKTWSPQLLVYRSLRLAEIKPRVRADGKQMGGRKKMRTYQHRHW